MSERLKTIWAGFEAKTTRQLTGRGVDNISAPVRADEDALSRRGLPDTYVAPADAAFAALRQELHAKAAGNGGGARGHRQHSDYSTQSTGRSSVKDAGDSGAVADLVQALAATDRRVLRPDQDYRSFLATNADKKLKDVGRRKKFLGLF